jgi:amidophosphoribosyltransferase
MYPCDFGISTRSYDELAARNFFKKGDIRSVDRLRKLEKWIAEQIDADSVKYNSIEAFVKALGIKEKDLCLKCFDGVMPIKK